MLTPLSHPHCPILLLLIDLCPVLSINDPYIQTSLAQTHSDHPSGGKGILVDTYRPVALPSGPVFFVLHLKENVLFASR